MAGLLSGDQLNYIRTAHEENLPQTCTIRRYTTADDADGLPADTWADQYTQVPCRRGSFRNMQRESVLPERMTEYSQWPLYLPYDQDILLRDRVVLEGDTYEVTGVDTGKAYAGLRVVQIERVE